MSPSETRDTKEEENKSSEAGRSYEDRLRADDAAWSSYRPEAIELPSAGGGDDTENRDNPLGTDLADPSSINEEAREHLGAIAIAGEAEGKVPPEDTRPFNLPDREHLPDARHSENEARDAVESALRMPDEGLEDAAIGSDFRQRMSRSEALETLSLTEAEDYARENIGVERVDYSEFDDSTAREVNATLEVLRDKYPEVGGLEYLGSIQRRNSAMCEERPDLAAARQVDIAEPKPEVVAVALRDSDEFNGIAINKLWASDSQTSSIETQLSEFRGDSSEGTGSMSGVVAHEFGHLVEYHLEAKGDFDDIKEKLGELESQGRIHVREHVSTYATKNEAELFAELFAEYQLSNEPRDPARSVGEMVDRKLRQ